MRTFTEIDECNKILNSFINANGQIWLFHVTHKRLVIRLWFWSEYEHKVQNEIFIAVLGCEHIRGAFNWKNVNMSIVKEVDAEFLEPRYRLIDKNSDFELIADAGIGLLDSMDSDIVDNTPQ
jgi:hypothetical protein